MLARMLILLATLLFAMPSRADPVRQGDVVVDGAWARAVPGGARTAAVYLTVRDVGGRGDRLVGAASAIAEHAALHVREMEGEITKMRPVTALGVPANGELTLAPGRAYVMLIGLAAEMRPGNALPLTLLFADAGRVTLRVPVLPLAFGGPGPQ